MSHEWPCISTDWPKKEVNLYNYGMTRDVRICIREGREERKLSACLRRDAFPY